MKIQVNQRNPQPISLRISSKALSGIMTSLASRPPEGGGILLGPVGRPEVTRFVFDSGGSCTDSTYTPDHVSLQIKLSEIWIPSGLDMKGFAHSHPGRLDRLSMGDLSYIRRILLSPNNSDMDFFVAPIVIPEEFRMVPFIVHRSRPDSPEVAKLQIH